jgi:hypothetical protein
MPILNASVKSSQVPPEAFPPGDWGVAIPEADCCKYLPLAQGMFRVHRRELEPLVTHRFPIQESQHAFTLYENHAQGLIKALLDASTW